MILYCKYLNKIFYTIHTSYSVLHTLSNVEAKKKNKSLILERFQNWFQLSLPYNI